LLALMSGLSLPQRPPPPGSKKAGRASYSVMPGRPLFFILFLLALAAGCERSTDPAEVEEQRAFVARGTPNTLPVLFEEALRAAQRREGPQALERVLAIWQTRQAEVQAAHAAGDPGAVQGNLAAMRNEEIRFVLGVLGPGVISRVLSETNVGLANARFRLIEAAKQGAQTATAEVSAEEINQLLSRATALAATDQPRALGLATEAAGLLSGIDDAIIDLRRLRGVETLFPDIATQLKSEDLRAHVRLQSDAHAALRSGNRLQASQKLAAVRNEEIRLVLKATNNQASSQLLQQVDGSLNDLRRSLQAFKASGADAIRRERMLATAGDLYDQAKTAEARGDHAKALDLSSHAAGLLNSLRHLLLK
jgi:hypothetical protein